MPALVGNEKSLILVLTLAVIGVVNSKVQPDSYAAVIRYSGLECPGSVVAPRYILTSADCVKYLVRFYEAKVLVGQGEKNHAIIGIHRHPMFTLGGDYVALVELGKKVTDSEMDIGDKKTIKPGTTATLVWNNGSSKVNVSECYGRLCAKKAGTMLLVEDRLVGIFDRSYQYRNETTYVSVSRHRNWINQITKGEFHDDLDRKIEPLINAFYDMTLLFLIVVAIGLSGTLLFMTFGGPQPQNS